MPKRILAIIIFVLLWVVVSMKYLVDSPTSNQDKILSIDSYKPDVIKYALNKSSALS